ncbi:hypothetical protein CKO33_06010 [Ectothiorhodospira mobilis]|nr:hypothetical protein [Ectothiorhodospira mobilis]
MPVRHHARNTGLAILGLALFTMLTGCANVAPYQTGTPPQQGTGMTDQNDLDASFGLREAQLAREQAEARAREAEIALAQARALASSAREQAEARSREAEEALLRARELEAQLAGEDDTADRPRMTEGPARDLAATGQLQQTARGMVLTLGDVLFDTGKAELKPGAARMIQRLSDFLAANPGYKAIIEGHTDSTGDPAFNRQLSRQRAQSVQEALVRKGISPDRIIARGLGSDYPIATNETFAGRQKNRRVEIILSDESGETTASF